MSPLSVEEAGEWLEWAVEGRPREGETISGDAHVVARRPGGALLAVIDGLGHGAAAATAAETAAAAVEAHATDAPDEVLRNCHAALRGTRGAVVTVVALGAEDATARWLGVGNVAASIVREADGERAVMMAPLAGGIVGATIPSLQVAVRPLRARDLVVLASDGIPAGFERDIDVHRPVDEIARAVLADHGDGRDDAIVLVARFRGNES